jgi:hypothetical protein
MNCGYIYLAWQKKKKKDWLKAKVEKNGDHQLEDLAKYSYKTEIKQKI